MGRKPVLTKEQRNTITSEFIGGSTIQSLADRYRCCISTIRNNVIQRTGQVEYTRIVKSRPKAGGKGNSKVAPELISRMAADFSSGRSAKEIAKQYGIHQATAAGYIRKKLGEKEYRRHVIEHCNSRLKKRKPVTLKNIGQIAARYAEGVILTELCRRYRVGNMVLKRELINYLGPDQYRRIGLDNRRRAWTKPSRKQKPASSNYSNRGDADKKVAERLAALRPDDRVIWMCSDCGHTYNGDAPPLLCTKCNRGGFEKNIVPRRLAI